MAIFDDLQVSVGEGWFFNLKAILRPYKQYYDFNSQISGNKGLIFIPFQAI